MFRYLSHTHFTHWVFCFCFFCFSLGVLRKQIFRTLFSEYFLVLVRFQQTFYRENNFVDCRFEVCRFLLLKNRLLYNKTDLTDSTMFLYIFIIHFKQAPNSQPPKRHKKCVFYPIAIVMRRASVDS